MNKEKNVRRRRSDCCKRLLHVINKTHRKAQQTFITRLWRRSMCCGKSVPRSRPVFGVPLADSHRSSEHQYLPKIMVKCIAVIERDMNIGTTGIYSVPADEFRIQALRDKVRWCFPLRLCTNLTQFSPAKRLDRDQRWLSFAETGKCSCDHGFTHAVLPRAENQCHSDWIARLSCIGIGCVRSIDCKIASFIEQTNVFTDFTRPVNIPKICKCLQILDDTNYQTLKYLVMHLKT